MGREVETHFFFNKVGNFAWYVACGLGGQNVFKPWQLKFCGLLTPIFCVWDEIVPTSRLPTVFVDRNPGMSDEGRITHNERMRKSEVPARPGADKILRPAFGMLSPFGIPPSFPAYAR